MFAPNTPIVFLNSHVPKVFFLFTSRYTLPFPSQATTRSSALSSKIHSLFYVTSLPPHSLFPFCPPPTPPPPPRAPQATPKSLSTLLTFTDDRSSNAVSGTRDRPNCSSRCERGWGLQPGLASRPDASGRQRCRSGGAPRDSAG